MQSLQGFSWSITAGSPSEDRSVLSVLLHRVDVTGRTEATHIKETQGGAQDGQGKT